MDEIGALNTIEAPSLRWTIILWVCGNKNEGSGGGDDSRQRAGEHREAAVCYAALKRGKRGSIYLYFDDDPLFGRWFRKTFRIATVHSPRKTKPLPTMLPVVPGLVIRSHTHQQWKQLANRKEKLLHPKKVSTEKF